MSELLPHSAAAMERRTEVQRGVKQQLDEAKRLVLGRAGAEGNSGATQELLARLTQMQPTPSDAQVRDAHLGDHD